MTTAPVGAEFITALSQLQAKLTPAPKTKTNPHLKNKYADLDDCWATARPLLAEFGFAVYQAPEAVGKSVKVTTWLMHKSGQMVSSALELEARDAGPQSIGAAITYARRYGFCAALGMTSDEDDDGNSNASKKGAEKAREALQSAGKKQDPLAPTERVTKMLDAFRELDVPEQSVLAHVGRASKGEITVADLQTLHQHYQLIQQQQLR